MIAANALTTRYAIIEVRNTAGPSERLVCAYLDEQTLRSCIAEPSIIAYGFISREQAQGKINILSRESGRRAVLDLKHVTSLLRCFLQTSAACIVLTFYSKNAVLSGIRSFLGGSF
jgi:hypothetical protein